MCISPRSFPPIRRWCKWCRAARKERSQRCHDLILVSMGVIPPRSCQSCSHKGHSNRPGTEHLLSATYLPMFKILFHVARFHECALHFFSLTRCILFYRCAGCGAARPLICGPALATAPERLVGGGRGVVHGTRMHVHVLALPYLSMLIFYFWPCF